MPIHNAAIARHLEQIADLLAVQGANHFRIRAYRTAAQTINSLPHAVASLVEEGADLTDLPGIGQDMAGKIEEIVHTGSHGVCLFVARYRQICGGSSPHQ